LNFSFTLNRKNEKELLYKNNLLLQQNVTKERKKLFPSLVAYLLLCRFEKDQPDIKNEVRFRRGGGRKKKSFTKDVLILMDKILPKKLVTK
jgi:hypothetical protein